MNNASLILIWQVINKLPKRMFSGITLEAFFYIENIRNPMHKDGLCRNSPDYDDTIEMSFKFIYNEKCIKGEYVLIDRRFIDASGGLRQMKLSKREFFNTMLDKDIKDEAVAGAAVGYACFVFSFIGLILGFAFGTIDNPYIIIEIAMFLLMSVGIHLLRSRICAVTLTVHYLVAQAITVYTRLQEGDLSWVGGQIVVIFFFASGFVASVRGTFRFHKAWKQYQAGQYVPKPRKRSLRELAQIQEEIPDDNR